MALPKYVLPVLTLASLLTLSACGSGGGGGSDSGAGGGGGGGTPVGTAEGFWAGPTDVVETTTNSQYTLAGTVLDDGKYWFLLDLKGTIVGLIQGSGSSSNGTYTTSSSSSQTRLDGSYVAKTSFTGTGTLPLQSGQTRTYKHAMQYDNTYESAPSFSNAGNTWVGTLPLATNAQPFAISITEGGVLTGTASDGCTLNGTLVLRAGSKRIYNASLTVAGACVGNQSAAFSGIAEPTSNQSGALKQRILVKAIDNPTPSVGLVILIDR
jgi:hypothetical protein